MTDPTANNGADAGALYHALFEGALDGMVILDDEGRCIDVNPALCEQLGASRPTFLGAPFRDLVPAERLEDLPRGDPLALLLDTGTFTGELPLRAADGTLVELEWSACRDIVPGRHLFAARPLGERRRFELDAHRLAAIVESSDDAIVSKDLNGIITSWNHAAERLFGYRAEEIVGKPITLLVPDDRPEEEPAILARLRRGERVDHYETVRVAKDGSRLDLSVTISPVRDAGGRIVGASKVARDIGAEKALREQLQQQLAELAKADRRKNEFLAMLAHELRNPLGAISNAVHLLREPETTDEQRQRAVEVLGRQVEHFARMVDDLLEVSRITRGLVELHREDVDLCALVRDASEDFRLAIEKAGITLNVEVPAHPLRVRGDPTRLTQVVSNLLSNAAKFSEGGGSITVTVGASPDGSQALLRVDDTGRGIEPELLPHVFDTFKHGDRTLARRRGGLGLGLAIVKGVAELHGGQAHVESPGVGKGTRVWIELPAISERAAPSDRPTPGARGGSLKVLVVEDHIDAAEMLQELLELEGHEAAIAPDGTEGLRRAREETPDVVLCDLGLPEMDGYDVAAAIQAWPALSRPLLVAVTGYGQDADRRRSREAGFDHHLVKPVALDDLRRLLSTVTGGAAESH